MRKKFNNFFWGVLQWLPLILIFVSCIMYCFVYQRYNTLNWSSIFEFIVDNSLLNNFYSVIFIDLEILIFNIFNVPVNFGIHFLNLMFNWFILVYIVEILYCVFTYLLKMIKRSVDL